jgi:hypothetical protein
VSNNKNLHKAHTAKADEFYTQLSDIENELQHYKKQFRGKVILCNCDDPYESNFFKYFAMNFNFLGLKKLIATSYVDSPVQGSLLSMLDVKELNQADNKHPYKVEITAVTDENKDGAVDLSDVEYLLKNKRNVLTLLEGDGDFRSAECVELLKQADIVVTNPPFSLFREYVQQLVKYDKKFLILGSLNAITYKEIFKLIKENAIWLGYINGAKTYLVPDNYEQNNTFIGVDGKKYAKMGNTGWYTNLDINKRHEELILYKKYSPKEFPRYDNYDAINVDKVSDIPLDYDGVMGVPITFLDKYNPKQFEIISSNDIRLNNSVPFKEHGLIKDKDGAINGKPTYVRIVIKNKELEII